ncbi:WbqC family protein [Pseudomonas sp. TE3610]
MKKIAISQSNYIPWKGYFDMISMVDEFILYDDMQYTRRDWRNRNQIKTPQGVQWLTVPVKVKGKYDQTIRDTEIDGTKWSLDHWKALNQNYRRTRYFYEIADWLEPLYCEKTYSHLSQLNRQLIESICAYLKIKTTIKNSWDYDFSDGKSERLLDICMAAGGTEYLSGPAAKNYLDTSLFESNHVAVQWMSYEGYPIYDQLWGEFAHGVSVLDLLFNCGPASSDFVKRAKSL